MKSFVDIHNHIAWNVDDGIETKEEAITVLKQAKADGITTIVSTPHYIPGRFKVCDVEEITAIQKELQLLGEKSGVEILLGSEIFLNQDYINLFEQHFFHPLGNSNYVLVEFDVRKNINNNEDVEDILYEIAHLGYRPVIAHVERYFHDRLDIERIREWIESGCVIQINRTSLLGNNGKIAQKNAKKCIELNLAHIVASDTHRINGSRICKMSDVYEFIVKEYGQYTGDLLCSINPKRLLENQELIQIKNTQKKNFLQKIFKKG